MNNEVAVRTNRAQVIYRIDLILFTDFSKRFQMMHMNDSFPNFAVYFFKIKAANDAFSLIMFYALISSKTIPFVAIYIYLLFCAFV